MLMRHTSCYNGERKIARDDEANEIVVAQEINGDWHVAAKAASPRRLRRARIQLDAEEQEILGSFERREWRSVGNIKRENNPGHDVRELDGLKRRLF